MTTNMTVTLLYDCRRCKPVTENCIAAMFKRLKEIISKFLKIMLYFLNTLKSQTAECPLQRDSLTTTHLV